MKVAALTDFFRLAYLEVPVIFSIRTSVGTFRIPESFSAIWSFVKATFSPSIVSTTGPTILGSTFTSQLTTVVARMRPSLSMMFPRIAGMVRVVSLA